MDALWSWDAVFWRSAKRPLNHVFEQTIMSTVWLGPLRKPVGETLGCMSNAHEWTGSMFLILEKGFLHVKTLLRSNNWAQV